MLIDLHKYPEAEIGSGDVCIIGAGAAGITMARGLAQEGHSVILLESGGFDFEQATQDLYRGSNVGMPYYDLDQARLRFFGGTVSIWGGRCAQLDAIDFEPRDWVAHSGWPIRKSDIDPYYARAHDFFELGEFNYADRIWDALGVTAPGFDPEAIDAVLWRFDEKTDRFVASHTRDVTNSPSIQVVLHANAVNIKSGADARTVEGVEVKTLNGTVRQVKAKHYVLACGAIENSRLLLASNDVEVNGLGNGHDLVGRYFMEHPTGRIGKIETQTPYELWALFQKRFMRSGPPLAPALRLGDATQQREQALNSIITFKLQRDPRHGVALGNKIYHNLKHSISPDRRGRALDHAYRAVRAWFHREMRNWVEKMRAKAGMTGLYLITRGEQAPNHDSRVVLSRERDSLGSHRADLDWQLSDLDKHTARVIAKTFDAEFRRLGMGAIQPGQWLEDPSPQWPEDLTVGNHPLANYHQVGGTRMSDSPRSGVVDANCQVHGYENLFIAGSSVFPTSGWANPTLTIVALSMRLSDHLNSRLKA